MTSGVATYDVADDAWRKDSSRSDYYYDDYGDDDDHDDHEDYEDFDDNDAYDEYNGYDHFS